MAKAGEIIMQARKVEIINTRFVKIGLRHRELREEQVSSLMQSITKIGLKTPITVRQPIGEDDVHLVAGRHRLEAYRRLGIEEIEAFVIESDDEDAARLWEIAENLHRADLTALQRDEHVAEWIRLSEKRAADIEAVAQVEPRDSKGKFKESGIRAAARELGVERNTAQRAVKVDSLTDEAKEVAKEAGLDNNRSALLEAAKSDPDQQADKLREIARQKEFRKRFRDGPPDRWEIQLKALHKAWDAADSDARSRFLENIGVQSLVGVDL
jgi:ParB/RepB/Spo0J family partition protein